MSEPAKPALPRYRCHKEVEAAQIVEIVDIFSEETETSESEFLHHRLTLALPGQPDLCLYETVTEDWGLKHEPVEGGFFVRYADGYTSYSPGDVFLAGYSPIEG